MKAAYYPILVLLAGLVLSFVLVREHPVTPVLTERNVSLAMRQIAHELLSEQEQRYAQIPQLKAYGDSEFILPVETHLDYNLLINIGPEILAEHGITENYNLALLDCSTSDLLLGFTSASLLRDGTVACSERSQDEGCHNLSFSLATPNKGGPRPMLYIMGSLALLSIILGKREQLNSVAKQPTNTLDEKQLSPRTTFSFQAQQIKIANEASAHDSFGIAELTYREAKLLDFLVQHPNEVLDRERIHAAVWGSEGVIVGRSLDVFISRLRKKLAADSSIEIITVHGVGYRLKM